MSAPTVIVITGANKGIGLALTKSVASRDNVVVYAGVRKTSPELDALVAKSSGKVKVLSITSTDPENNKAAAAQVKKESGYVNLVIANAGMATDYVSILESSLQGYEEQFRVNTLGAIVLYQAFYELLVAKPDPKFIVTSTLAGSITIADQLPYKFPGYQASKAALNILIKTLHGQTEKEGLITFPIHPGTVDTDGANAIFEKLSISADKITTEESAAGVLKVIDAATRATNGGKFMSYDGTECPW